MIIQVNHRSADLRILMDRNLFMLRIMVKDHKKSHNIFFGHNLNFWFIVQGRFMIPIKNLSKVKK
jgi:hypothetical protein